MLILADTREQTPFVFARFPGVELVTGTLPTGDYSLPGLQSMVACERKELDDLIACLQGGNRDRFEKELARGAAIHRFCVLVEASMEDVARGRYRSEMAPKAALVSIMAFQVRYGTTFLFCGNRAGAEYACHEILSKYLAEIDKRHDLATKHQHPRRAAA